MHNKYNKSELCFEPVSRVRMKKKMKQMKQADVENIIHSSNRDTIQVTNNFTNVSVCRQFGIY